MTTMNRGYGCERVVSLTGKYGRYIKTMPSVSSQYLQPTEPPFAHCGPSTSSQYLQVEASGSFGQVTYVESGIIEAFLTWFQPRPPSTAFRTALAKLNEISSFKPNWDKRGALAPSEMATAVARNALERFQEKGLEAERVAAIPDGGIAIYYFGSERIEGGARARYARLAIPNYDTICLTLANRSDESSTVHPIRPDLRGWHEAAELVAAFIGS